MEKIKIYHNKSCSKSRAALQTLVDTQQDFEIINYLETAPTIADLKEILKKLDIKPHDLIRTNEPIYKEKYKGKVLTDDERIIAMYENPILIQRPIVIEGDKARIAR